MEPNRFFRPRLSAGWLVMLMLLLCASAATAGSPGQFIFPDETDSMVLQWADVTAQEFLEAHQMPASEIASMQIYARQDLRDSLRAFAWSKLRLLIADARTTLDPVEQRMISRFAEVVKLVGSESVKLAVDEKNRFLANRCTWKPDPELSKMSGYTYDGTYNCPRTPYNPSFDVLPPLSPTKDYFMAFGQKKSWVETIARRPGGTRSIAHISAGGALFLGIGIPAALLLGVFTSAALASMKVMMIKVVYAGRGVQWISRGAGFWIGIGITIAIAALTIAIVIFLVTENDRIEAEYPKLDSAYAELSNKPAPGRAQMAFALDGANDSLALYAAFLRMVVPTLAPPSPAALPVPGSADPLFVVRAPGAGTGTTVSSITFPGWDGERTRVRLWRGWFLQEALVSLPDIDPTSINTRIRYQWYGKKYEASRIGSLFAVLKVKPADTDQDCPPDSMAQISIAEDFTRCRTFVTRKLPMDLEGLGQREVALTQPVSFTNENTAKVALDQPFSIPITTLGLPEPLISANAALPSGFTVTPGSLLGTATLNWSGSGALGTQTISLKADNGIEVKTMNLQVSVSKAVQFTSPSQTSYTFEAGKYVSIPVVATGYPEPTITVSNFAEGCGLQLRQITGSEYRLSGYIHPGPLLPYIEPGTDRLVYDPLSGNRVSCNLVFEAANANAFDFSGLGHAYLEVKITVTPPAAQPVLLTKAITTPAGLPRQYIIQTGGTDAPVNISLTTDSYDSGKQLAPSWVGLRDLGNGTAVLSVTPPANAPDSVLVPLWYRVPETPGNWTTRTTDGALLHVQRTPLFTWPVGNIARFDVGSPVDQAFGAQAQDMNGNVTFQIDPALPAGLQLTHGTYGAFQISGRATQEGDYNLKITATNSYGSTTEQFRIIVAKAAKIDAPPVINFYMGRNSVFEVTASGFPRAPIGEPGRYIPEPMTMSTDSLAMFQSLPLRFDTRDPVTLDPYYGRVVISGTPSKQGRYPFKVSAQTAGLPADIKSMELVVTTYGDVNGDFVVNCSDVTFITSRLARRSGSAGYDYNADINRDGVIDQDDLKILRSQLSTGTTCQ